jgi:hypothetical protein
VGATNAIVDARHPAEFISSHFARRRIGRIDRSNIHVVAGGDDQIVSTSLP